jgi:hypothetical protein
LQRGLDDELAVLYKHVLVGERRLLKFSISVASQYKFGIEETSILTQIRQLQLPSSRLKDLVQRRNHR